MESEVIIYNVSLWNWLFQNMKQFISKELNSSFEKCAIEIDAFYETNQWKDYNDVTN